MRAFKEPDIKTLRSFSVIVYRLVHHVFTKKSGKNVSAMAVNVSEIQSAVEVAKVRTICHS